MRRVAVVVKVWVVVYVCAGCYMCAVVWGGGVWGLVVARWLACLLV